MNKNWNVGWGFTNLCNLNCVHCYNSSGKKRDDELSIEQAFLIVDKLEKNNVKTINYGTGESGLVPEFWDLIRYADSKNVIQGLTTNGISINRNTIELVKDYLNDVDVSIDYPFEYGHNKFRGSSHAWNWAIEALNLLKENNISFSIVTCLHAKNSSFCFIDMFLKLAKKYNCEWRINWFRPTGRGKQIDDYFRLNPKNIHNIFLYITKKSVIKALPDPYFSSLLGLNTRKGCPCGKDSFRITPNGTVVPCVYFTKEFENLSILEYSFDEIIKSQPFYDINNRDIEICKSCEYFEGCNGGCASRAFLRHGTMNAPDAYCYKIAGASKNPLEGLSYSYEPDELKVHDNYLCTMIIKPK